MFDFFKKGLSKTIDAMRGAKSEDKISKEILEEMLLEADVGYELVEEILEKLPAKKLVSKDDLKGVLKNYFGITPLKINSLRQDGKVKRFRGKMGARNDVKKFYVKLPEGVSLESVEA